MRRLRTWVALTAICWTAGFAVAQDDVTVNFCEGAANCIPDTLEIRFGGKDGPSTIEAPANGTQIDITVVSNTSDNPDGGVQGWSYGVSHDPAVLTIVADSVTTAGTDAAAAMVSPFFDVTQAVNGGADFPPGFVSAVVLSFTAPAVLPVQLNSLAVASYTAGDITETTLIQVEDNVLRNAPSPPVAVNITVGGNARLPATLVQGQIVAGGGCEATEPDGEVTCDDGIDNDCDELVDGDDPDCQGGGDCPAAPVVTFCDGAANCIPDTLEIIFDDSGTSTLDPGGATTFGITVVSETSDNPDGGVQGWSYGVSHDPDVLTIVPNSVTTAGTDAAAAMVAPFFDVTQAVAGGADFPPGFVSAVVLSFTAPATLPIQRNTLAKASYDISGALPAGGTLIQIEDNVLRNAPSPPVAVNITVGGNAKLPSRLLQGLVCSGGGGCVPTEPDGEVSCEDGVDNDCDDLVDAADPDCAGCEPTEPDGEVSCEDGLDNDCDDLVDAADPDCAGCEPTEPNGEVTCDDGVDNDCDDLVDAADPDCQEPPEGYVLYFGSTATAATADPVDGRIPVSIANPGSIFAFQFGVATPAAGNWTFTGEIGDEVPIEIVVSNEDGTTHCPEGVTGCDANDLSIGNDTSGVDGEFTIEEGAAIAGLDGDLLLTQTDPQNGGPGFFVGYIACLAADCIDNAIPASGDTLNELVVIVSGEAPEGEFIRGDADGNGRYNIADPVIIIQVVAGRIDPRFACMDALDANDNGRVEFVDAVPVINYIFRRGDPLPAPFPSCGVDPTDDELECAPNAHPQCIGG